MHNSRQQQQDTCVTVLPVNMGNISLFEPIFLQSLYLVEAASGQKYNHVMRALRALPAQPSRTVQP